MTRTIAFYGDEPRIGKTTAVANLAILLARSGQRTCIAHLDPGWPLAKAFNVPAESGYVEDVRPRLDLALWSDGEAPFHAAVESLNADILLVDAPPECGDLSRSILQVADDVIFVARATSEGVSSVARDVGVVTELMRVGHELHVRGLLLTMADPSLNSFERFLVQVERAFPVEVFPYGVPRPERGTEEVELVVESAVTGRRARAYVELAMEVMQDAG